MDQEAIVHIDLRGATHAVGRLWTRIRKGHESASFEYDRGWLTNPERFALEPALNLGEGAFHTAVDRTMFGAIGDSAPDRWGRTLMRRAERKRAAAAGEAARSLREIDFLLHVDDEARQGALRFAEKEAGPFLAAEKARVPPLIELPRLLSATERLLDEDDTDEDLRLLLAPGSSLGGARPKTSVRDKDGHLAIAKFPRRDDEINTVVWEAVALTLAAKAGLAVPEWRLETITDKPILILRRFDRAGNQRVPFLSAMSMLGAADNEARSYLEFVDALRRHGAAPKDDMRTLWERIVFSILISNTDDHLRNQGFLYAGGAGWRLSPAYDLNPVPADIKPRVLSTTIDLDDGTASLDLALSVSRYFELKEKDAKPIVRAIADAVSTWRGVAASLGMNAAQINRMSSAFEHKDLEAARAA